MFICFRLQEICNKLCKEMKIIEEQANGNSFCFLF